MDDRLTPCPACARHVRAADASCPFCGAPLGALPPERPLPRVRLGRAAIFAFGAALASVGCAEHHGAGDAGAADAAVEQDAGDAPPDSGTVAPPYGAPPDDAGVVPLYGGAP